MTNLASTFTDDALLDLLFSAGDQVPRDAIDEIVRRGARLVPRLAALIDDEDLWITDEAARWAPIHATFILAAMKAPGALDVVLRALELAVDFDEPFLIDTADSMLASFGPHAVPALIAAYPDAGSYPKLWINDALTHIATAHSATRDAVREHLLRVAMKDPDPEICACAAWDLLPFATAADRPTLEILVDRRLIEKVEMENALAGRAESPLSPPLDWLRFYSPEEIARRQEGGPAPEDGGEMDLDEVLPPDPSGDLLSRLDAPAGPPPPIVNSEQKTGRNAPCPCGSGKKYKKCCGA
jgi:hypothetical protein